MGYYLSYLHSLLPFKAANQKNNFLEALGSLNDGNWRVPGERIMLCLTVVEPKCK